MTNLDLRNIAKELIVSGHWTALEHKHFSDVHLIVTSEKHDLNSSYYIVLDNGNAWKRVPEPNLEDYVQAQDPSIIVLWLTPPVPNN